MKLSRKWANNKHICFEQKGENEKKILPDSNCSLNSTQKNKNIQNFNKDDTEEQSRRD